MTLFIRLAVAALVAGGLTACAQTNADSRGDKVAAAASPSKTSTEANSAKSPDSKAEPGARPPPAAATPEESQLDAELFYRLLVGELNALGGDPGTGFSLMLNAAEQTGDPRLYKRAADIALQARSGDSALKAAQAWKQAMPESREANRYVLQILVALNRIADTGGPLKSAIALAPADQRKALLQAVPRAYSRASDKKLAATVVEQALSDWLKDPSIGAASWIAIGRVRLAAGDSAGALDAARRAQKLDPGSEGPVLLALEMMGEGKPSEAESIVRDYIADKPLPEVRMSYARVLIEAQRYAEAREQLRAVTVEKPDLPEAWLLRGALQAQDSEADAAEKSLKRYLDLSDDEPDNQQRTAGRAQAFLTLSQIAEKRKDYDGARAWLDKIPDSAEMMAAQLRRASLLARQGKLDEARQLLRALPERTPADARTKLLAEVQLLRDNKKYQEAYDLLKTAIASAADPTDLLYDQAMLAEKLNRPDEMEQLLRRLIAAKPDYHHAYNALGYSLADRNVRLVEAKQLIEKALSYAPGDPFISDSLGWVEFRAGHLDEAERILAAAYKANGDADIAAHYGEVLWNLGKRDLALEIWRQGLRSNPDSETLRETLKRLRAEP